MTFTPNKWTCTVRVEWWHKSYSMTLEIFCSCYFLFYNNITVKKTLRCFQVVQLFVPNSNNCKTKRHWNTIQVRNKGYQSQARSNNIYTTLIIHPTLCLCRHLVYFLMYLSWILNDCCIIHPITHDIPNNFLLCTVRDIQRLIWQLNGSCLILYLEHWIHFVEFFLPNDFYAKSF